jgi:hypothetical protein
MVRLSDWALGQEDVSRRCERTAGGDEEGAADGAGDLGAAVEFGVEMLSREKRGG